MAAVVVFLGDCAVAEQHGYLKNLHFHVQDNVVAIYMVGYLRVILVCG